MRLVRRAHLFVAWAFVVGVVVQVFLAGLGVFDDPATFRVHATWGYTLELMPLLLVVLAVAGRLGRRQVLYAAALFGMFMLQSVFVALRSDLPMIAAIHPVNGFAILLVGIAMARDAWIAREGGETSRSALSQPLSRSAADGVDPVTARRVSAVPGSPRIPGPSVPTIDVEG